MREIRKSGSEGGAGQTNVPFLPRARPESRILFFGNYLKSKKSWV